jgi:hypothetical protein
VDVDEMKKRKGLHSTISEGKQRKERERETEK